MTPVRLYLRRVMCNPNRAETTQQSDEDRRRTIISLQGGKSFGRAASNDVVFLDGNENVEKEPQYISRCHARVYHTNSDGIEAYYVEDQSENGTYINDRRLSKTKREILKNGDTIKFGHKNGAQHLADQIYTNPDADFAFRVEMSKDGESLYDLVEQIGDSKVKVFAGNACSKEIGVRESPTSNRVLQQEADSTNGGPEGETSRASPSVSFPKQNGSTSSEDSQMPSTSEYFPSMPVKAPLKEMFDTPVQNYIYRTSRYSPLYRKKVQEQADRIAEILVFLKEDDEVFELLIHLLDIHVAYEHLITKKEKLEFINIFCERNRLSRKVTIIQTSRQELAEVLVEEEPQTIKMRELLVELSEKPAEKQQQNFMTSPASAFRPHTPNTLWHPTAVHPNASDENYIAHLRSINVPTAKTEEAVDRLQDIRKSKMVPVQNKPLSPQMMQTIQNLVALQGYNRNPPVYSTYIGALSRVMEIVPVTSQTGVITSAGVPKQANKSPAQSGPIDIDDERNSASSGSTDVFRRRTDSEGSEIVDVVGTDDTMKGGKVGNENETSIASPKDRETNKQVEENTRKSTTPRIEAQSTPSAVVSALPTPLSSPTPKADSAKLSAKSQTSIPAPVVTTNDNQKISENSDSIKNAGSTFDAPVSDAPEKVLEHAVSKPSVSFNNDASSSSSSTSTTATSETTSSPTEEVETAAKESRSHKRQQVEPDESSRLSKQPKPQPTTPSVPTNETPKKKQKELPSRKMKQLDESSVESDSEDGEKSDDKTSKKKTVRRSTRTAKSPIVKKPSKKVVEDDDDQEDEEKATPRSVRRKNLKRTASQSAIKERKAKGKEVDKEENPKKKRGRKKASPAGEERSESDKEKCGVSKELCLCAKFERRKNLQWVSCSECNQWFHVWCVRLDNVCYREDENFSCCGPNASKEAKEALAGHVHERYFSMSGRRPVPQSPDSS